MQTSTTQNFGKRYPYQKNESEPNELQNKRLKYNRKPEEFKSPIKEQVIQNQNYQVFGKNEKKKLKELEKVNNLAWLQWQGSTCPCSKSKI